MKKFPGPPWVLSGKSAIPAIVGLYDREFATVVIYSIRRIQDEALRSLTGTKDSRAAAGWKEFVNAQ